MPHTSPHECHVDADPSPSVTEKDPPSTATLLQEIEKCEDMMHQWLITQHERPATTRRNALLVVRFEPDHLGSRSQAHFFFDGPLQHSDDDAETGSCSQAVRQTMALFDTDLQPSTARADGAQVAGDQHTLTPGAALQLETARESLQRRELVVAEKESMITTRFKELRATMLRAEELEFQLRQYALGLAPTFLNATRSLYPAMGWSCFRARPVVHMRIHANSAE